MRKTLSLFLCLFLLGNDISQSADFPLANRGENHSANRMSEQALTQRFAFVPMGISRRPFLACFDLCSSSRLKPKWMLRTIGTISAWAGLSIWLNHMSWLPKETIAFGFAMTLLATVELSVLVKAIYNNERYPLIYEFTDLPAPSKPWVIAENDNGVIKTANKAFLTGLPPWIQRIYLHREQHALQRHWWGDWVVHLLLDPLIPLSYLHRSALVAAETVIAESRQEVTRTKLEASIDFLTGALKRGAIEGVLRKAVADAHRGATHSVSVIFIDGDKFKDVNDKYGHGPGDQVLQYIVKQAQNTLRRETDFLGRWGGEEFLIVLSGAGPER